MSFFTNLTKWKVPRLNADGTGLVGPDGEYPVALIPSGGDDTAQLLAALAKTSTIYFGPGVFKFNTPNTLLAASKLWRSGTTTWYGPTLIGSGSGKTVFDTSGMGLVSHETATCTAMAVNSATTTITLSPDPAWSDDATKVITIQQGDITDYPASTPHERIHGMRFWLKSLGSAVYQLYTDSALTQAYNSSTFGTSYTVPCKVRRYNTDPTQLQPTDTAFRFVGGGSQSERGELMAPTVRGITFTNSADSIFGATYERHGIALNFESDSTSKASNTCQGLKIEDVKFDGYEACVQMDDCTNNSFDNCNFQNNSFAFWLVYNIDLTSARQCRFGDDTVVAGQPLQRVMVHAPHYYKPTGTFSPGNGNEWLFESCWMTSCFDVAGYTYADAVVSGATGREPVSCNPLQFKNTYWERIRTICAGQPNVVIDGCHFGNFIHDVRLNVNQSTIEAVGGANKARISIRNCTCDFSSGGSSGPSNGYFTTYNYSSPNEIRTPNIFWENNTLGYKSGGYHIRNVIGEKITFTDNAGTGDNGLSAGLYYLAGMLQIAGTRRISKTANNFSGTLTPDIANSHTYFVGKMNGAVTVANPVTAVGSGVTFATRYAASGEGDSANFTFAPLQMLPIMFIFQQDATGGRAVSFGTDFVLDAANAYGGSAAANTKSTITFAWSGSKFVQCSPAMVWA